MTVKELIDTHVHITPQRIKEIHEEAKAKNTTNVGEVMTDDENHLCNECDACLGNVLEGEFVNYGYLNDYKETISKRFGNRV